MISTNLNPIPFAPEDAQKIAALLPELGVTFQKPAWLKEALIHRSFLNENRSGDLRHNERLEFLGDAVLELAVTEFLYNQYPTRTEGELTSFRAAIVRTESLAFEAERLKLGEFLYMSKGEENTGGRNRPYILANTFEAILGAIYLDQDYQKCVEFLAKVLFPKLNDIVENRLDIDAKSKLQEVAQETVRMTPTYNVLRELGPDHDKTFTMSVNINNLQFGSGTGRSKQEAEQNAAQNALENWQTMYEKYSKSVKIRPAS